ncbi:glycosyltransferase family 4 protein [Stratiformator vulcanicus]|uniref:Alpha-D-kanosaminyltransferase n=1 Tax=Stratiformator vulcanicus TaxID=2527980 RepID=A0A517R5G6_9PLAN|nr:glycosyltransferase family 4 protein [Stratiformator vulcanicus]QDT39131.1 Alpha-D-kanosaminyltransferase [Stratiformator vulcanicus]
MSDSLLKVLLFSGRFEVRASSSYTLRLARRLPEFGVEPRIVCTDARRIDPELRNALSVGIYPHLLSPVLGSVVFEGLRRDQADDPPDLVHAQSLAVLKPAVRLAKLLGCPCIVTFAASPPATTRFPEIGRGCQAAIAISSALRNDLIRRNRVRPNFVRQIHSGVDIPEVDDLNTVLEPGHTPVVGTAGPLEISKGLPYFLGAAARVLASHPQTQFLVSGAGPEEHNLRRLARELKLDGSLTFASSLYDFSRSMSALDIFCLPSLQQGLGATMLEAMANGRPVVATRVGGVDTIVTDGETGLIVPPSDSSRLSERIIELLDDPPLARRIGDAGRTLVRERFQVARMVAETAALYGEVIAGRADLSKSTERKLKCKLPKPTVKN